MFFLQFDRIYTTASKRPLWTTKPTFSKLSKSKWLTSWKTWMNFVKKLMLRSWDCVQIRKWSLLRKKEIGLGLRHFVWISCIRIPSKSWIGWKYRWKTLKKIAIIIKCSSMKRKCTVRSCRLKTYATNRIAWKVLKRGKMRLQIWNQV